jgi:hypothetical protein
MFRGVLLIYHRVILNCAYFFVKYRVVNNLVNFLE